MAVGPVVTGVPGLTRRIMMRAAAHPVPVLYRSDTEQNQDEQE